MPGASYDADSWGCKSTDVAEAPYPLISIAGLMSDLNSFSMSRVKRLEWRKCRKCRKCEMSGGPCASMLLSRC